MSKILVIDDDLANREILRARLEPAGYEVIEASQGEEGLLLLETVLPDLILLDVMMPKMDGWQVCRKIKANPRTKSVPVVMLTALGQKIDQLRGWESGISEYLTKPWDPVKLLDVVKQCLAASLLKKDSKGSHE